MDIILLERVENLGQMGDTVTVKNGYARNFLLPRNKALRATKDNIAYFEQEKAAIEKRNNALKSEAEKLLKNIDGVTATIVRVAPESGQLYGAVNARDMAEALSTASGETIKRDQIRLTQNYKTIGLFPVEIVLHAEVIATATLNIARSEEEAKVQAKTGQVLISSDETQATPETTVEPEVIEEALLEDSAIKAKEAAEAAEAQAAAEEAEKQAVREAKKAAKAAAEAEAEAQAAAEADTDDSQSEASEITDTDAEHSAEETDKA